MSLQLPWQRKAWASSSRKAQSAALPLRPFSSCGTLANRATAYSYTRFSGSPLATLCASVVAFIQLCRCLQELGLLVWHVLACSPTPVLCRILVAAARRRPTRGLPLATRTLVSRGSSCFPNVRLVLGGVRLSLGFHKWRVTLAMSSLVWCGHAARHTGLVVKGTSCSWLPERS